MKANIQLQKLPKAAAAVHVTSYVQLYLTVGWRSTNIKITVLTTFGANYLNLIIEGAWALQLPLDRSYMQVSIPAL